MTMITFHGTVQRGIDNAGYFGPVGADLSGDPWTLTVTGTDCDCYANPITGMLMTVNGFDLDITAAANAASEWLDRNIYQGGLGTFVQLQTPQGRGFSISVQRTPVSDGGVAYLGDDAIWLGPVGIPGPELGAGWPVLLLLGALLWWWRRRAQA